MELPWSLPLLPRGATVQGAYPYFSWLPGIALGEQRRRSTGKEGSGAKERSAGMQCATVSLQWPPSPDTDTAKGGAHPRLAPTASEAVLTVVSCQGGRGGCRSGRGTPAAQGLAAPPPEAPPTWRRPFYGHPPAERGAIAPPNPPLAAPWGPPRLPQGSRLIMQATCGPALCFQIISSHFKPRGKVDWRGTGGRS